MFPPLEKLFFIVHRGGPEWLQRAEFVGEGRRDPSVSPGHWPWPSGFSGNWDQCLFGVEAPESWLAEAWAGVSPVPWVSGCRSMGWREPSDLGVWLG